MLKQKARTVALAVLVTDLALTAVSLPLTWALRHGVLTTLMPTVFPLPLYPLNQYVPLLSFVLPIWGLLLYSAGFYRSHRTLPLGEELWAAAKVSFGGTAILVLLIYGLRLEFVSRWFLVLFGFVNFLFLASREGRAAADVALGPLPRLQFPDGVDRGDRAQGRPVRRLPGSPPALGLPGDRLPRRRQRGRDPFARPLALPRDTSPTWGPCSDGRSSTRSSSSSRRASSGSTRKPCSWPNATACPRTSRSTSFRTSWRGRSSRSSTASPCSPSPRPRRTRWSSWRSGRSIWPSRWCSSS